MPRVCLPWKASDIRVVVSQRESCPDPLEAAHQALHCTGQHHAGPHCHVCHLAISVMSGTSSTFRTYVTFYLGDIHNISHICDFGDIRDICDV